MGPRGRRALATIAAALALLDVSAIGLLVDRADAAPLVARGRVVSLAEVAPSSHAPDRTVPTPNDRDGRSATSANRAFVAPSTRPGRALLVHVERSMPVTARPGGGAVVGTLPATSRYYGVPLVAWVQEISRDGRYGLVTVPYMAGDRSGWIALRGLEVAHTTVSVEADVSAHRIVVRRGDDVLFRAPAATGAPATPTPAGSYFVTDRVSFPGGGALGTFAFGLSGIQPNLPVGWSGGDQLAIHGTDAPSTIGTSASAGCLRVSEATLSRLEPLLRLGTPVVIHG